MIMDIRLQGHIKTAEHVDLNVELAGLGNRVFAFMIDFWIMICLIATTVMALGPLFRFNSEFFKTVFPVIIFLYLFGFHFFQEWLTGGKTIGKSITRIRVVRNNGQPVGFWEALGRNLLRVVDVYFIGIGLIVMMLSRREKRFGDYLAGTLVTYEHRYRLPETPASEEATGMVGISEDSETARLDLYARQLSGEEHALIESFLRRKGQILAGEREALQQDLSGYLARSLHCSEEECSRTDFLEKLAARHRHQAVSRQSI